MKKSPAGGPGTKKEGKNMKKAILGICAVTLALSLAACGGAPASGSAPASQPASASQPSSEPASQPASEPASEPAEADYTAYTLQFDVPEGFAQAEENPEGVSATFQAEDGSVIQMIIYENDGSLASDVTQEAMVPLLEETYSQQMGTDVTLQNVAFETGKLAEICPYYRLSFTIELNGVTMNQTAMGINADRAYTLSYTDVTGGDWTEAFEDAIASITPVADSSTTAVQGTVESEGMVWISESGEKYHSTSECSNMKNPWQVSESEALAQGRTPCEKCW